MQLIFTLLSTAFSFLVRNPLITKMLTFTVFLGVIAAALAFAKNLAAPYIVQNQILSLANYFGAISAVSLYISIIVAGWGAKQVVAFIRS
jgi:hypothetical protein